MDTADQLAKTPSLRDDPEYRELDDKRASFGVEREALETERAEIQKMLGKGGGFSTDRSMRVAALLGDAPSDSPFADPKRLNAIDLRLGDLHLAINELNARLMVVRDAAARRIVEPLRPTHLGLVREIALALITAQEASARYAAFADSLNSESISWASLDPHPALLLGDPGDRNSRVAVYVRKAAEMGAIAADEIPKALR